MTYLLPAICWPYFVVIVITTLITTTTLFAQSQSDQESILLIGESKESLLTQTHLSRPQTYVTLGEGIGNLEELLWEGQLAAPYTVAPKSHDKWVLRLEPKVVMRMIDSTSYPLRNPSYHVDVNYHRRLRPQDVTKNGLSAFVGIGHHSNGKDGIFFYPGDTIIDLNNGNFAQNYLNAGITSFRNGVRSDGLSSFRYLSLYTRITPPFTTEWTGMETVSRIGFYRSFIGFGIGGVRAGHDRGPLLAWRKNSSLTIQAGWIIGEMKFNPRGDLAKRSIIDAQYHYGLPFFQDVSLFARFYRGQDYMNIRFSKTLSVLSFGVSANIAQRMDTPIGRVGK